MPDAGKQLQVIPEREPITEREAQMIGDSAQRLARLRGLVRKSEEGNGSGGSIVVGSGPMSSYSYLPHNDLAAALAFLIERDELFLASYNVKIERTSDNG